MLKLFKRMKYAILSRAAERKLKKKYGCNASIKMKLIRVRKSDGKIAEIIKTEIAAYETDYAKLINVLLTKGH